MQFCISHCREKYDLFFVIFTVSEAVLHTEKPPTFYGFAFQTLTPLTLLPLQQDIFVNRGWVCGSLIELACVGQSD